MAPFPGADEQQRQELEGVVEQERAVAPGPAGMRQLELRLQPADVDVNACPQQAVGDDDRRGKVQVRQGDDAGHVVLGPREGEAAAVLRAHLRQALDHAGQAQGEDDQDTEEGCLHGEGLPS